VMHVDTPGLLCIRAHLAVVFLQLTTDPIALGAETRC